MSEQRSTAPALVPFDGVEDWPVVPDRLTNDYVGTRVARVDGDVITTTVVGSITYDGEVQSPLRRMAGFADASGWRVHPDDEPLDPRIELVAKTLWSRSHTGAWTPQTWPLNGEARDTYEDARAVLNTLEGLRDL